MLLAPVVRRQKGEFRDVFERLAREGFVRARVDGEIRRTGADTRIKLDKKKFHNIEAVVDRLVIDDKIRVRLGDSVETALRWGEGVMFTLHQLPDGRADLPVSRGDQQIAPTKSEWIETLHSNKMCSPATGKSFDPPTPKHFSFNAPAGACPVCHGLGQKMIFDEHLVVPDPEQPLESAIQPWRRAGQADEHLLQGDAALRRRAFQRESGNALERSAGRFQKSPAARFRRGRGGFQILARRQSQHTISRPFEGVLPNLERLFTDSESEFIRNRLKPYMSPQFCDVCKGKRLKPEILAVTLGGERAAGVPPAEQTTLIHIPQKKPDLPAGRWQRV